MSHSSVLENVRKAFDSNSVETLEDINLRLLNQVNSLPSLSSRELSLRGRLSRNISADIGEGEGGTGEG